MCCELPVGPLRIAHTPRHLAARLRDRFPDGPCGRGLTVHWQLLGSSREATQPDRPKGHMTKKIGMRLDQRHFVDVVQRRTLTRLRALHVVELGYCGNNVCISGEWMLGR